MKPCFGLRLHDARDQPAAARRGLGIEKCGVSPKIVSVLGEELLAVHVDFRNRVIGGFHRIISSSVVQINGHWYPACSHSASTFVIMSTFAMWRQFHVSR